ncbi:GTP cyclohydrolase I [Plasmodium gaboni]|uniref:GTP cyclohydrolase 1 n=1 Tax=Plasmodium gaboni TaxID=647221 RepID=A0A151LGI2_9APIC|nr:GTP cyclohydrolase I [Plasmodium gaboni]KYN98043.1 GTP cyclohydrolase I [Plasmodium gaboni]
MEEKKKKSYNNNFSGLLNNGTDDNNKKEKLKNSISKMYINNNNRKTFNDSEKEDLVVIEEKNNKKKKKKHMINTFEQDSNDNMNDNKRLGSFFKINDKCESINENMNNINKESPNDCILFENINKKEYFRETKEENNDSNKSNDIEKINCINVKKKTIKKNKKKINNKIINNNNKTSKSNEIEEQIINISKHIYKILNISKLPNCDILKRTNKRYAETFLYLTNGYNMDIEQIIKRSLYKRMYKNNSIIKVTGIHIYSLCKHHLLPFEGTCDIEYIPKKYIIGLSKFSRIVDVFSRRLQLQEDLTNDICNALKKYLKPLYIKVSIVAKHLCINMRGVKEHDAKTITHASYKEEKENSTVHSLNMDCSVENLN